MMAAVNHVDFDPPSPRPPPPAMDELETLALDDDDDDDDFSPHLLSTVPVAIDSGDPLLRPCPPSSSSSSSPSSSPTAASVAVFESHNGVGGGRGRSGAADAIATEFVGIAVSKPEKAHDPAASLMSGSSTFVTYLITARAASGGGEFRVRRRFRDVVALADRLAEAYRGLFVPARPDKSVVEGQVMQKHEFVEQRRAAIERYLRRLAAHPVIGRSEELRAFLRAPGRLSLPPQANEIAAKPIARESGAAKPMGKGGRDLFRMFRELKQSVVNDWGGRGQTPEVDEDKEFLERKAKLQEWEKQLSSSSQQVCGLLHFVYS